MRDVYHKKVAGGPEKGSKTGIVNSIDCHKILSVEFDIAAISVGCKFSPVYTSTLFLVRVDHLE